MAHPIEKRMALRSAYIGGLPLEAAADKAEVPYGTARNWFREAKVDGDDWDRYRAASMMVAGGGIEQAMATLGDTVAKLKAAGKGMMPEADQLAIENGAIKAFADLMIKLHPKTAEQVLSTVEAWANGTR